MEKSEKITIENRTRGGHAVWGTGDTVAGIENVLLTNTPQAGKFILLHGSPVRMNKELKE